MPPHALQMLGGRLHLDPDPAHTRTVYGVRIKFQRLKAKRAAAEMDNSGGLVVGRQMGGEKEEEEKVKRTERDMRLLGRLNAFGFMNVEQIADFWGVDFSTAARRVRKLIRAGMLERLKFKILSARPLVVTKAGCVHLGDTIPPMRGIRTGTYRHDALVVDLALALERRFGAEFETERQLKSQPGPVAGHLPDGVLHLPDGRNIGVELELTQKSQVRLTQIVANHAGNLALDEIWYVIVDEAMRAAVARATAGHSHIKIVKWTPPSRRAVASTTSKSGNQHDITQR